VKHRNPIALGHCMADSGIDFSKGGCTTGPGDTAGNSAVALRYSRAKRLGNSAKLVPAVYCRSGSTAMNSTLGSERTSPIGRRLTPP
jgi:hypothetical protein